MSRHEPGRLFGWTTPADDQADGAARRQRWLLADQLRTVGQRPAHEAGIGGLQKQVAVASVGHGDGLRNGLAERLSLTIEGAEQERVRTDGQFQPQHLDAVG